jgi:Uma2 family endonuclease
MSTLSSPLQFQTRPKARRQSDHGYGDQRIVIQGADWQLYDRLSEVIGEGQHVRVAYDGENLEIMTTGYPHEGFKDLLGKFVAAVTQAFNIDRGTCGETAWKRPEINRGLQADQSYYFDPDKRKAAKAAWARKSNDIADYPNPDLAIEIDLSDPKVDRPSIYAALRVAEIWQFDGENVIIEHLQEDGTYALSESSRFLPIRAEYVRRWLVDEDSSDELVWERRLEEWARGLARPA